MINVVAFDIDGTLIDTQAVLGKSTGVMGAAHAWLRRAPGTQFAPWGVEPDITLESLDGLASRLRETRL
ncbi:MAG: hypothetical protein A2002_08150 [Pseudomonadales bacterium GWC1_66_9]|nr:MAG: hypothetical protein A2002_08150 [Pseudomonadales bacterium GWC1_66_9]